MPGNLPSKVTHRLTMTAGAAAPETLTLATTGPMVVSGANVTVGEPRAISATLQLRHEVVAPPRGTRPDGRFFLDLTLAPGATAVVETDHGVRRTAVGE